MGAQAQAQAALDEAADFRKDERWPEALSAPRRAQGVLAGFWADPALRRQVDELAKELEMAQKLQEARLYSTAIKEGHLDWEGTEAAHAAAFQEYGLDVDGFDPRVAGEQIRLRPIHRQLVAALDDWAYTRRKLRTDGWGQRLAVARAADPDPQRNRLRDALEERDRKALEEPADNEQADGWEPETLVLLGRLASGTASAGHVAVLLGRAQQGHPADFWINETLAALLSESRPPHLEEAIRFYSVAVGLRPRSPAAHLNLGLARAHKGRLDEASGEFREAVGLKQDFLEAHNDIGVALERKGQLDESITKYREVVRLKPDFPEAHYNIAWALKAKGQLNAAIAEYREALRIKKDNPEAHNNLGNALQHTGGLDEAIAEYREALRLRKDDSCTHYNMGNALRRKGQLDAAIAEYREAVRLDKDFAMASKTPARLSSWPGSKSACRVFCKARSSRRMPPSRWPSPNSASFVASSTGPPPACTRRRSLRSRPSRRG
jgi:serine/threonine-protein kinase